MKVTESMVVFGHTLLAFDGWIPADAVGVVIEGKEHLFVPAYDIGKRLAVKGEYSLAGTDIAFVMKNRV